MDKSFDNYVGNPCFPYTYFELQNGKVIIAHLETKTTYRTARLTKIIKKKLSLEYLTIKKYKNKYPIKISKKDLLKNSDIVYSIIREIMKFNYIIRIADHTEIKFKKITDVNIGTHQLLLLKKLKEKATMKIVNTTELPFHRDKFWISLAGKTFASNIRDRYCLSDHFDIRNLTVGEYFTDYKRYERITKDASGDDCVVCLKKQVNVICYPCEHAVLCDSCVDELNRYYMGLTCVICRGYILKRITFR